MTYSKRLRLASILVAILFVFSLVTPTPTEASIHEIIAALCHGGEIVPPGQNKAGQSFIRALQATGFIVSIVESATNVTITFDPTVPNSKFMDAGVGDVTIPNAIAPGVDLILSPGIKADPNFPAHAHCPRFPPQP